MVDKRVIEEIKSNTNIVEIIGEVISLQKSGRNFLGLCPFHGEKTPSFNVVEDKQFYHCFGCGRSGDVFKFIEEYQQVTFADAVRMLGERLECTLKLLHITLSHTRHPIKISTICMTRLHAFIMQS